MKSIFKGLLLAGLLAVPFLALTTPARADIVVGIGDHHHHHHHHHYHHHY